MLIQNIGFLFDVFTKYKQRFYDDYLVKIHQVIVRCFEGTVVEKAVAKLQDSLTT